MTPYSFTPFSMRLPRRLITADRPLVMAILNATPDSFYAASRADGADAIARRAERLIADGADEKEAVSALVEMVNDNFGE